MATTAQGAQSTPKGTPTVLKRVIFSMGGKGGVGKSTVMAGIAEYLQSLEVSTELLDLDWENKREGSLTSWFPEATKIDIRKANAYDILIDRAFRTKTDVVLADLGHPKAIGFSSGSTRGMPVPCSCNYPCGLRPWALSPRTPPRSPAS
jgi:hypothetical protein